MTLMPRCRRSSTTARTCAADRPNRSDFQNTRVSPGWSASRHADWYAFALSFKGVLLEGLEVAFIVVTFVGNQGNVSLAALGAALAVAAVVVIGVAVRAPLAKVPENTRDGRAVPLPRLPRCRHGVPLHPLGRRVAVVGVLRRRSCGARPPSWDGANRFFAAMSATHGIEVRRDDRCFSAVPANTEDAAWLEVQVGAPLLLLRGTNSNARGQAVAYVVHRIRGDRAEYAVRVPH